MNNGLCTNRPEGVKRLVKSPLQLISLARARLVVGKVNLEWIIGSAPQTASLVELKNQTAGESRQQPSR